MAADSLQENEPWRPDAALQAAIEAKSIPEPNSGCWLWLDHVSASGYGGLRGRRFGRSGHRAHRLAFIAYKGNVPAGMEVCHRCDVPSCVNPDHLWVGTTKQNAEDRDAKGRGARGLRQGAHTKPHTRLMGERAKHAKLTAFEVAHIRSRPRYRGLCRAISLEFGLHPSTVHDILVRNTWKHIP